MNKATTEIPFHPSVVLAPLVTAHFKMDPDLSRVRDLIKRGPSFRDGNTSAWTKIEKVPREILKRPAKYKWRNEQSIPVGRDDRYRSANRKRKRFQNLEACLFSASFFVLDSPGLQATKILLGKLKINRESVEILESIVGRGKGL